MKKLILLLLFIPLVSIGQDFRKMSFGESIENLTEKYPDINFEVEEADGVEIVAHEDIIAGIPTVVAYIFQDKKLVTGMYNFDGNTFNNGDEGLKNYKAVSEILNAKYSMKKQNKWHKSTWKDDSDSHGHALGMGDVDFVERYDGEDKTILHQIMNTDGALLHIVTYMSNEFKNQMAQQNADDF
tara:strand:- start:556 stop:1107 length:552 start_codon:yes stop_codon:yes gene_type:complete